jgi:hypothetical protein
MIRAGYTNPTAPVVEFTSTDLADLQ